MSDKRYPTRVHEVLGVEPEERFTHSEYGDRKFWLSESGLLYGAYDDGKGFVGGPTTQGTLVRFINNPERITRRPLQEDDDGKRGLYSKYKVTKADGTPLDGDCFVLRPDRDEAAISALEAYADATNNENLAADIREWLQTPRLPRLTEEQVRRLKALYDYGMRWIFFSHPTAHDPWLYATTNKPSCTKPDWDGERLRIKGSPLNELERVCADSPLDIVQTLRDAGVEIEEDK